MKKIIWLLLFVISLIMCNLNYSSISKNDDILINVEVKGNVSNPGIYQMPYKSTVNDLLKIAIPLSNADLSNVNLSSYLYPEMVIVIEEKTNKKHISINGASIEELCQLPGIKDKLANEIIIYRNKNGSFKSLEELMNVKGIGQSKFNKIKSYICL